MTSLPPDSAAGKAYPLPRPDTDQRFTFGLTFDVAKVLESAGYPPVRGVDVITLQQALFSFLYAAPDGAR